MQRAQPHAESSSNLRPAPGPMPSIVHFGALRIDARQESRIAAVRHASWWPRNRAKRRTSTTGVLKSGLVGLLVLGMMAGAAAPQPDFDCARAYKDFWEKLDREAYAKMPPEQLVVLSRRALRIYDACQTGDVEDAKGLFERLVKLIK